MEIIEEDYPPHSVSNRNTNVLIDTFTLNYRFLSNFYPSTLTYKGKLYPTVEHAYQAAKTTYVDMAELIRKAPTPAAAKKMGRLVPIREDWNEIRVEVMRELIKEKFCNPLLRQLLVDTGTAQLVEYNNWNDRVWGVCRGRGANLLGKLLMQERNNIIELQKIEEKETQND